MTSSDFEFTLAADALRGERLPGDIVPGVNHIRRDETEI